MSFSFARVILIGNLGKDPEVRYVGDQALAKLNVAVNEQWTDGSGQRQEKTHWFQVDVWGAQAEACGKYLAKGASVCVDGKLQTRSYEKDGVVHYVTDIRADRVGFLDRPPAREEAPAPAATPVRSSARGTPAPASAPARPAAAQAPAKNAPRRPPARPVEPPPDWTNEPSPF